MERASTGSTPLFVLAVALLAGSCAPGPRPAAIADPPETDEEREAVERLDRIFAEYDDTRSPGCAVAVVDADGIIFSRGYGMANLEHGVPLDARSSFRTASVTKQFTAAVILILAEEGKLSLRDDVRDYIRELPDYGRRLTIRHLIHHTSGIRDYLTLQSLAGVRPVDGYDKEEVLSLLGRQESLNFLPGDDFLYSNSGYLLLAAIVERVTGRSIREYAREHLFEPLGMTRTWFHDDHTRLVEDRAVGYGPGPGGEYRTYRSTLDLVGDGGVYTSVEEMARWERFHLSRGSHPLDFLRNRLPQRGVLNSGDTIVYAHGLQHGGHRGFRTVGHGGSYLGYRTGVVRYPTAGISVIVFCNRATARPGSLSRQVAAVFLDHAMRSPSDSDPDPPSGPRETPDLSREELEAFAGDWWSEELQVTYRIRIRGDFLRLEEPRALEGPLAPLERDTFRLRGATLRFVRSGEGRAHELRVDGGRVLDLRFVRADADLAAEEEADGEAGSPDGG